MSSRHCSPCKIILTTLALVFIWARTSSGADDVKQPAGNLPIQPTDHISIIGGTLADRMQHDGWLETSFYSRFPGHDLVFRNLGFAGDELKVRLRSANFGTPEHWLTKNRTDVVLAFFGYNESFAGAAGVAGFKKDLESFIKKTTSKQYNGRSAPRLVLFSPIAHEDLHNPNLPDGRANNERLELYTTAMAAVCRANNIPFVDLFHPTKDLYTKNAGPLTINGIHLNSRGNELVAQLIDKALFPNGPDPRRFPDRLDKIRRAVLDKNRIWFNRYRTVDGYSIYGGRAGLRFVGGQTNKDVMDREMEVLDVMTVNRDARIWAVAQGGDLKVNDANTPAFIPVLTNKPGPLDGKHVFLDPEEAIKKMTVAKGMKVNVFASERDWPELANPVQMSWDTKGRLWVAVWPTYPHWKPKEPMNDKLIILEDTKGTGRADKMTVFADDLHCPTGFEFWNGGVLLEQGPDLIFLKDTTGAGKADLRVRVLQGMDTADTHHTANSFVLDPGGALYFQEGTFHHTQVETPYGPPVRNANAGVYRYEPRTQKFETYISFGFANPHGHVFDRWGQDIVVDGTGAVPYHAALFSGQIDYPERHAQPPTVYRQKTRPCAGTEILSSRHFPEENQGNFLVANVIVPFQGILQYKIRDKGASFEGIEAEPIVYSSDPNFRPSDIRIGPDGAIYFMDWHNPIIGHMQHNLRDPNRDHEHGRIYRVTYEGRPLLKPAKIAGEPVNKLLDLLKSPEDRVRYWTRIELGGRASKELIAESRKWLSSLDPNDPNVEHHKLEALWLHQNHNIVNEDLLRTMLHSPDFHARAAATRVLCYWRDRVRDPLNLLHTQINDVHPRVRLEAIRALSFFHDEEAWNVALELLSHPDDAYLQFTFTETLRTLERRLGSSAKLDRKNIAVSLLKMLDKEQVKPERKPALIESIIRHGGAKELQVIWDRATQAGVFPPALRKQVLGWLAETSDLRRVRPAVSPDSLQKLLAETAADASLLAEAIRLAAAWKVKESAGELRRIAQDKKASAQARFAAIDGLAALSGTENVNALRDLTAAPHSVAVRFRAAVALAAIDIHSGADAAATALAAATDEDDPSPVIEAFLVRKDGSDHLAAALAKQKLSPDNAKRILRSMLLAGRNDAALANVAGKLAGLEANVKPPTPREAAKVAAEVQARGDAARGERIFHRADLGCLKCHAIGKAGGSIGPDLGPVGAASPLDYIVTSILDPSLSIKEEYLTKVIATSSGLVVTGIPIERGKNQLVLKDATGKHIKIATADIESEANGKSLMPEGITRFLTHGEQLDLIRFVSELGKPGPFQPRTTATIQRWHRLRDLPLPLLEGVPNREIIRESILGPSPGAWETTYSLVSGKLPLDELLKPGRPKVLYLQGEVQVRQGGNVEFLLESTEPATFWIDEDLFEKQARAIVPLAPGRHFITVRVAVGANLDPTLRLELRKPSDSKAGFEVVNLE